MGEAIPEFGALQGAIEAAYVLVVEAITRLDEADAPADIAAHLDFARHRMMSEIEAG